MTSTLIGATKIEQLENNLAAAQVELPKEALQVLDEASALEENELDSFFGETMQSRIHGGTKVEKARF